MKFDHYSIRSIRPTDLNNYYALVENNRECLEDFFAGTVSRTGTFNATKIFLKEMIQRLKEKSYFPFVIEDCATNKLVGFLDLKNIDWSIPKSEIGFYIDKDYSGKGITSKAVKLVCDYTFSTYKFKKLYLRTHILNMAARKVAENNGFEEEGVIRSDYKTTSGRIVDLVYYGKLSE